MNTVPPAVAAPAALRPRAAVLQEAWDAVGVDAPAFVGRSGQLLARAVKCLVDPLVLRPRANRSLAQALLGPDDAAQVRALIAEAEPVLVDASRWFPLLRAERRRLAITDGNVQELYFPRAFELATIHGAPGVDANELCREALGEIHTSASASESAGLFNDPAEAARLESILAEGWKTDDEPPAMQALADAVLAVCVEEPGAWEALLSSDFARQLGAAARSREGLVQGLLEACEADARAKVSADDPLRPPPLATERSTLVLDRSIASRLRAALRRHRAEGERITAEEALDDELARAVEGWGLHDQALGAAFVVGIVLAAHINPLADLPLHAAPSLPAAVQARLRKEAYVLHQRRLLANDGPIHACQQRVIDELREFWRPYSSRLWARLHGWDVTGQTVEDQDEVATLLTGVARSVSMDHRERIRQALEREAA